MKKKDLWVIAIILVTVGLLSSCEAWQKEMGQDLLPSGDDVFLYHDTIMDIQAYTVSGKPVLASDRSLSSSTLFLLGNLHDPMVGSSEAGLFTQYNTTTTYKPGPDTEIDSVMLILYIEGYYGNVDEDFTIRVHEMTERVYMDSLYYTDYDPVGKFGPVLAEKTFSTSDAGDTVEIMIQDQAFIEKFLTVQTDTALFANDSLFKNYFNGFYLTAGSVSEGGTMAEVGLSNLASRLSVRYANDSTESTITTEKDFKWATFGINEYYSQKINVFEQQVEPGSHLASVIDNEEVETPYCYVQGMEGVNTMLSFTSLQDWVEGGKVAINSAYMVLDVVPGEISGIDLDDLADRLILYVENENEVLDRLQDHHMLSGVDEQLFGGQLEARSKGMFQDTTYTYRFKMPLHFQAMVDGQIPATSFRLGLYNPLKNPSFSLLWSNLNTNPSRIRLEVVYLKL